MQTHGLSGRPADRQTGRQTPPGPSVLYQYSCSCASSSCGTSLLLVLSWSRCNFSWNLANLPSFRSARGHDALGHVSTATSRRPMSWWARCPHPHTARGNTALFHDSGCPSQVETPGGVPALFHHCGSDYQAVRAPRLTLFHDSGYTKIQWRNWTRSSGFA